MFNLHQNNPKKNEKISKYKMGNKSTLFHGAAVDEVLVMNGQMDVQIEGWEEEERVAEPFRKKPTMPKQQSDNEDGITGQ